MVSWESGRVHQVTFSVITASGGILQSILKALASTISKTPCQLPCQNGALDRRCHSGVLGPAPLPTAGGWRFSNFASRMFYHGSLKSSVGRVFHHENQDTPKSRFTSTCCPGLPYFENLFPSHPQCFGWIHTQLWCCGHDTEPTAGPQDREGQTSLFFLELCCANSPS